MTGEEPRPPPLLDWHDKAAHWGRAEAPCRHCHQPTQLRYDDRKPAHKVCAERALAAENERTNHHYEEGGIQ